MKATRIIYWVTTVLVFLFEGVIPLFTYDSEAAREGMRMLMYPHYFGFLLMLFKVGGGLVLVLPFFPRRMKEWAYAGFTFDFLFASLSYLMVSGLSFFVFFPLIVLGVLLISYITYYKLYTNIPVNDLRQ